MTGLISEKGSCTRASNFATLMKHNFVCIYYNKIFTHFDDKKSSHKVLIGMGDNRNSMSRYIIRVIITIVDIIMISFNSTTYMH